HLATVEALANLGVNYKSAGRLDKAIPLLEEALRAAKQYPQLLAFTPELLDAYEKAGKKGGRVEGLEQTLEFRNETCGPDPPDTPRVRDLVVVAYRDAGKLDRAVRLLEETLRLRKARLGADHPDTLRSMNNLGAAYWSVKDLRRSVPLLEGAL